MKYLFSTLLVALLSALSSCESGSTEENLKHAEYAIEHQDYNAAKGICDNLRDAMTDAEVKNAATLCNLSILYMKLSDSNDREDNISMARQCYLDAYAVDSAEANDFYNHLPVEDIPHISLLTSIVRSTTGSHTETDEEYISENDSIFETN